MTYKRLDHNPFPEVVHQLNKKQDTQHVLSKTADLQVEGDVWLIGIDVESFYTLIPYSCGLRAVEMFLDFHYPEFGPQN